MKKMKWSWLCTKSYVLQSQSFWTSVSYQPTLTCPLWTLLLLVPVCSDPCPPAVGWIHLHTSLQICNCREQFEVRRGVGSLQNKALNRYSIRLQFWRLCVWERASTHTAPNTKNEPENASLMLHVKLLSFTRKTLIVINLVTYIRQNLQLHSRFVLNKTIWHKLKQKTRKVYAAPYSCFFARMPANTM